MATFNPLQSLMRRMGIARQDRADARDSSQDGPQAGPGQLPSTPPAKAPNRPLAMPSFKTQVARAASALQRSDRRLANTDISTYRTANDTRTVVRDLAATNPDLSATLNSYLRVGIPEDYTVVARDMDGAINVEATKLAQEMLRRITFLGDVTLGYNPVTDLQSLSESLAKELIQYGSMAVELALDKQRLPLYISPVSVTKIQFKEEEGGVYPIQVIGGEEISLDVPTFFYLSVDQDLLTAYSSSLLEPAIQAVLADTAFLNDLRKSMQRVIQPRLVATIIEEKVKQSAPIEIQNDAEQMGILYQNLIDQLTQTLTNLNPEDAIVSMDGVTFSMLKSEGGTGNIADTLAIVQKLIESKLAAGAKSNTAVLGRDTNGSAATTSTMLFIKNANIVRTKLNTIYSRLLTQGVRLQNHDVFVEFRYADIDLRPVAELEAYRAMKQSRILEQLSLGLISDEEACIQLTGNLPRDGHTPLSGTMFKSTAKTVANPASQTSTMNQTEKTLDTGTPAQPKS
jgi:hypothetical protein